MQFTQNQLAKLADNDRAIGAPQGASAAQIWQESRNNPAAVSPRGALGYAQVMPDTLTNVQKALGRQLDPTNFDDSLQIQRYVMTQNMQKFGNYNDALRAYNSGWNPAKWDNDETTAYVSAITGEAGVSTSGVPFVASGAGKGAGIDPMQTPMMKALHMRDAGQAAADAAIMSSAFDSTPLRDSMDSMGLENRAAAESAAGIAMLSEKADFVESFVQAAQWDTLTGRLRDAFQAGEPDPNWRMSDAQKEYVAKETPEIWADDHLREYVGGAMSQADYLRRLSLAQQQADYQRRAAQSGWTSTAGQLMAGVGDPVMLVATLGAGSIANAARAAFAVRAAEGFAGVASSMAEGAAGNMLASAAITRMDNGEAHWPELFRQGVLGAMLGGMGHSMGLMGEFRAKGDAEVGAKLDGHALDAHIEGQNDHINDLIGREASEVRSEDANTGIRDSDVAAEGKVISEADTRAGDLGAGDSKIADAIEEFEARQAEKAAAESAERAEYSTRPTSEFNPTLDNQWYREMHDAGVMTELPNVAALKDASAYHAKYGEDIPADAKAFYSPQDDRVYVIRDRLSAADVADPRGMLMHEVGVHYGLERAIGTERYNTLLASLEKSADPRVAEARAAVPSDTPAYLRGEETLGYLVEKHPNTGFVRNLVSSIRNWLRDNVGAFRKMSITGDDAIRYVRGSLENVRRVGAVSHDMTFPYVWHGSPVRGIDKLDLAYAGSGEGNAAFGYGHYVTSEKGTALDYRNKEAVRRGLAPEDGGLYRVKVSADPAKMLDWTAPAHQQRGFAAALAKVGVEVRGTGAEAYRALSTKLGGARQASEYLNAHDVPGVRYATGRTRGRATESSNYVLFGDEHLDIANRYSRGPEAQVQREDVPLGSLAQQMAQQLENWKEVRPKETANLRRNASMWYDSVRKQTKVGSGLSKVLDKLDSIGLTLGRSQNKDVRYIASMLGEDATGANRQHASSAAIDKVILASNWRKPVAEMWNRILPELMTNEERVRWSQGIFAGDAEKRISRMVQDERLANRNARLAGEEYVSQAHPMVKQMAAVIDGMWKDMTEMGAKYGESKSTAIGKRGWQGYMPYSWDWRELQGMYNDPERAGEWNSFKGMLRQQYVAKVIDPALEKLTKAGPVTQDAMLALQRDVRERAASLTDRYLTQIIRDPESRISGADDHFGSVAADMLNAEYKGKKVTAAMADEFKRALKDVISDRTRTEFDLLARQPDGVRLLDYLDTDVGRMVEGQSSEFAGRIALAKVGFKDDQHWTAMKDALVYRGASHEEVAALDFLHRSLTDRLNNKDNAAAQFLGQTAYMSMMGKLGFNALADAASIMSVAGVNGMFKSIFKGMGKDSALMKQLNNVASSAMGLDHRLHFGETRSGARLTRTGSALEDSAVWRRVGQQGMDIVGKLSGAHYVAKTLHRGFVPMFAEDLAKAIRGSEIKDGVIVSTGLEHLNPARLVDSGLTADRVTRIKDALGAHDAARKDGDIFSWDQWDKTHPGAAEDMIAAIHRVTGQALQRAFIGETPRWLSEGIIGKYAAQFKKYGITAQEKQLMRNAFIADRNSATGFVMGTAWGAALYYAKTMASTVGMTDAQREKYVKEHMHGLHLASGVAVMTNVSGMLGDGLDAANVLMGGQTGASGSPIVAVGQLQSMSRAIGAVGGSALGALNGGTNPLTGKPVDYVRNARTAMRVLPGANTLIGAALANELNQ
ncbi:transglycosylase SLT domain-containing protein [Burkholderia vietnamiensis]|uniref:transglycosylase SLT domain-containing protein n=1 Tax=Burkholderia vietnamiensis TaxID=60552 RepID=UPI001FC7E56F|nr:transglycosylase SLT domain-containing protein [Burkholderia vietnamiensis]